MSTYTYDKGDRVYIINSTMSGTAIIEGQATIVRRTNLSDEHYEVDFNDGHGAVDRFVDPAAQSNPKAFIDRLNAAK